MSDETPTRSTNFLMLTLRSFAGDGVIGKDGNVVMAFTTDGPSIDVTMTRQEAKALSARLAAAAK